MPPVLQVSTAALYCTTMLCFLQCPTGLHITGCTATRGASRLRKAASLAASRRGGSRYRQMSTCRRSNKVAAEMPTVPYRT